MLLSSRTPNRRSQQSKWPFRLCLISLIIMFGFAADIIFERLYYPKENKFLYLQQKLLQHRENMRSAVITSQQPKIRMMDSPSQNSYSDDILLDDVWNSENYLKENNEKKTLSHVIRPKTIAKSPKTKPNKSNHKANRINTFIPINSISNEKKVGEISSKEEKKDDVLIEVDYKLVLSEDAEDNDSSSSLNTNEENSEEYVDSSKIVDLNNFDSINEDLSETEEITSEEEDEEEEEIKTAKKTIQLKRKYLKNSCLKKSGKVYEHRTYPRPYEVVGFAEELPREWDWRNVSGENYCSPNRNQHIPVYCGSCWVFGSLGALNDRFNIARKNRWPMTLLSPQEIIACGGKGNCNGGEPGAVYEYAKTDGLVEEGCNNYKAVNEKCDAFTRCGSCWPDNCFAIQNYTRYHVKDYGTVSGRLNMMAEIRHRGPIACSMGATEKFELGYTGGIYSEYSDLNSNHIVSVTGWGYDEKTKTEYWIVRNSWGDAWGEKGWFRVVTSLYQYGRGDIYNMGIERECYFADPDVSNLD